MLHNSSIQRSLDAYISSRIREIESEIRQTFPDVRRVWKCDSEVDFLYGYYVGKIEEGALRYLLKATRASAGGYVDAFEIRGMIESHRARLYGVIRDQIK